MRFVRYARAFILLLTWMTPFRLYAADKWCFQDGAPPPCDGAKGKCTRNSDGSQGGFVAEGAKVKTTLLGKNVPFIGLYAQICPNTTIADTTRVESSAVILGGSLAGSVYQTVIEDWVVIHKGVRIQPMVTVKRNSEILENAVINKGTRVGAYSSIGKDTIIGAVSTIGDHVIIGNEVRSDMEIEVGEKRHIEDGAYLGKKANRVAAKVSILCTYSDPKSKERISSPLNQQYRALLDSESNSMTTDSDTYEKILESCKKQHREVRFEFLAPVGIFGRTLKVTQGQLDAEVESKMKVHSDAQLRSQSRNSRPSSPEGCESKGPDLESIEDCDHAVEEISDFMSSHPQTLIEKKLDELRKAQDKREANINAEILKIQPTEVSGGRAEYALKDQFKHLRLESALEQTKRRYFTDSITVLANEVKKGSLRGEELDSLLTLLRNKQAEMNAEHQHYAAQLDKTMELPEKLQIIEQELREQLGVLNQFMKEEGPKVKVKDKLTKEHDLLLKTLEKLERERSSLLKDPSAILKERRILKTENSISSHETKLNALYQELNEISKVIGDIQSNAALKTETEGQLRKLIPELQTSEQILRSNQLEVNTEENYFKELSAQIQLQIKEFELKKAQLQRP